MIPVTLLSDFGLNDASAGITKGILLQHIPAPHITDISHLATPFKIDQFAYLLSTAWDQFPKGTFHIVLCDLFKTQPLKLLITAHAGHYFLSADNGIVGQALGKEGSTWSAPIPAGEEHFAGWVQSAAILVKEISAAGIETLNLTQVENQYNAAKEITLKDGVVHCDIVHIDNFENVVLNIKREQFETLRGNRAFRLQFAQIEEITELSSGYSDVRPGTKLCRFNSDGFLEICVNRGNAARLFGLHPGNKKNEIQIIFE